MTKSEYIDAIKPIEECEKCELKNTTQNIQALKDYCTYTLNRVLEFLAL